MSGIYIHIPFCKKACYYCDFHFSTSLKKKNELISCLQKELFLRRKELQNRVVETIYFGGGTPSLLSIDAIKLLINSVYKNYTVSKTPEITLEANPDDLSKKKIIELSKTPINRLSIGVQSFFEEDLKLMNRAHNAQEAKDCLEVATRYFNNITIDLIYGIPNMSNNRWEKNLQIAFAFGVHHISSYALTVEPKTALELFIKQGKYPNVNEITAKDHFDILIKETAKNGFIHYEISNFGKPNYFSKHNTGYWQGKKYIGIGPSAHSFDGKTRSWNISNNIKYNKEIQQNKLPKKVELLSKEDVFNEYIMTGLRTIWGVSLDKINENFKVELLKSSEKFIHEGFLKIENNILKTTEKGKFLVDGIASELFII